MPLPRSLATLAALGAIAGACDAAGPDPADCVDDQCEGATSRAELLAALEGHDDPVARHLRAAASARGTLVGDYRALLDGAAGQAGCAPARERSFVVLSNLGLVPKPVVAACADDAQAASALLATIPALRQDGAADLDPQVVHLAAWDEAAATYRTYGTRPDAAGELSINVEPRFCLGCHGGPHATGFWQPFMNEMTNPWSQWNAEPGFRSQLFDEALDREIADGPTYRALTADERLDSASNLEPIVRAGIDRVVGARLAARGGAADPTAALALLRPLFCDETINFASEIHGGGELRFGAVVDRAIVPLFAAAGRPLSWASDTLRLPPPADGDAALTLIPVRGESSLAVELGLVARQVLAPTDALRLRALDHGRPVLSAFRCELWRRGAARVEAGALDAALDALGPDATIADLLPVAFDELLRLETADGLVALAPPAGGDAIAIAFADAEAPATAAALAAGDLGGLAVDLAELDRRLAAQRAAADRVAVAAARRERGCEAIARYPTAPIIPDLDCP